MNYYKKYNENNEVYVFASSKPPKRMDGLTEITEEEFNSILAKLLEEVD